MAKKQYSITIDPAIWDLAKLRIGEPMSQFIQRQLELACRVSDEKAVLENEIHDKEKELIALRAKLCSLEKSNVKNDELMVEECLVTLERIFDGHGFIGRNQVSNIADLHGVSVDDLLKICRDKGFVIHDVFEPDKEKVRNPVTGKY